MAKVVLCDLLMLVVALNIGSGAGLKKGFPGAPQMRIPGKTSHAPVGLKSPSDAYEMYQAYEAAKAGEGATRAASEKKPPNIWDNLWDATKGGTEALPQTEDSKPVAPSPPPANANLHHGPTSLKDPSKAFEIYQAYQAAQAAQQAEQQNTQQGARAKSAADSPPNVWDNIWKSLNDGTVPLPQTEDSKPATPTSPPANANLHHGPTQLKSPSGAFEIYQAYQAAQAAQEAEQQNTQQGAQQAARAKSVADSPPNVWDNIWKSLNDGTVPLPQTEDSKPATPTSPPANANLHHGPTQLKSPSGAFEIYQAYQAAQAAQQASQNTGIESPPKSG